MLGQGYRDCTRAMGQPSANADLITILQALPIEDSHRGVRYSEWLPRPRGSEAICQAASPSIQRSYGSGHAQGTL